MMDNDDTTLIFTTPKKISKETSIPYKQILNDIKLGKLPAVKIGKSYYIYNTDSSRYIYNLVCKARGIEPNDYDFLLYSKEALINRIKGDMENGHK